MNLTKERYKGIPDLRRLFQNPSIAQLFLTPNSLFYFYILRE